MAKPKQKAGIRPKKLKSGELAYEARYRDPSGRQRSKQFRRKADAQRFLNDMRSKRDQGQFVDPALGEVKLEPFALRWLDAKRNLKPKTRHSYEDILRARLLPEFGDRRSTA
jgi:hypothetical protein